MNVVRLTRNVGLTALALFIASAGWFGGRLWWAANPAALGTTQLKAHDYAASTAESLELSAIEWPRPRAQSRGPGWTYEIFTPPEIFYDAVTQSFRVSASSSDETFVAEPAKAGVGFELMAVEAEPFPLQLLGYVGEDGHYLGTFENVATSETLLLSGGSRLPDAGLIIENLTVKREPVAIPDSMTVRERRASAVVRDERSGRRTVLSQGERCLTDRLFAKVRMLGETGIIRVVHTGDTWEYRGTTYRIIKIRLAPAEIEVSKETPGASIQTLKLSTIKALPSF